MATIGTKHRPAVVRVQTPQRAEQVMALCHQHGVHFILGIEPDKTEDISDVEHALSPALPMRVSIKIGRNDRCPCGSGKKFKKCCAGLPAQP
jgi:SWIM/SEC-C metal-binding protein